MVHSEEMPPGLGTLQEGALENPEKGMYKNIEKSLRRAH
jgi:hypothetical protein